MDFFQSVVGKIASGLVVLAVIAAGISWWQTDPQTRHTVSTTAGRLAGWGFVVLGVPWISYFALGWLARLQSNSAGAAFVLGLTAIEAAILAWLFAWNIKGPTQWILYTATVLSAGVYNLFACDWIAEKAE